MRTPPALRQRADMLPLHRQRCPTGLMSTGFVVPPIVPGFPNEAQRFPDDGWNGHSCQGAQLVHGTGL